MSGRCGALLLAAGFSNRFGSIKLCARLNSGETVFSQTLRRLRTAIDDVIVVTRPELAVALAPLTDTLHIFDKAEQGMGASLAYAISLAGDWEGCLVCLADMPFIQSETYSGLAQLTTSGQIVLPRHNDRSGNPVGFGRDFFPELAELRGDHGGKPILQAHPEAVTKVELADPAILYDIDTPDDLTRLQALAD